MLYAFEAMATLQLFLDHIHRRTSSQSCGSCHPSHVVDAQCLTKMVYTKAKLFILGTASATSRPS
jgi:hypothetical protein